MIEKLGITPGPWEASTDSQYGKKHWAVKGKEWTVALCGDINDEWEKETGHNDSVLIAAAPEMLEALIDRCLLLDKFRDALAYDHLIRIVEKATGKTWQEIKELLND